jgi:hypothetical protein
LKTLPRSATNARPIQQQPLECRGCSAELRSREDVRWECECGIAVCQGNGCFDEYFKVLSDGESTRCRSCGGVV